MLSTRFLPKAASLLARATNQNSAQVLVSARYLNLQEYQSKGLLRDHGVNVQRFVVVESADDAARKLKDFKAEEYVVKAQILAGGRGKGHFTSGFKGGVRLTRKSDEVVEYVDKMIGYNLITKQTPKQGVECRKVMVAESVDIDRETYMAILMDRETSGPVIVASPAGGMDIEEVAKKTPEKIFKYPINIGKGLSSETAREIASNLGFTGNLLDVAQDQVEKLYKLFLSVDATQIEINPLSDTTDKRVFCIDAKLNFDDFAQFRQKDIFAMDDKVESDPREVEAEAHDLNYIGLDGNIACLVNGAGLAMATMDIIKLHGGMPANFLDVGGTVTEDQVLHAFKIITTDPQVKAILVNIFGGIVNCVTIANGLTNAFKRMELKVPLVVRLEGTNVNEAKQILQESKLPIITADDFEDAAKKACSCV